MNIMTKLLPAVWLDGTEKKIAGMRALALLVNAPTRGQLDPVTDPKARISALRVAPLGRAKADVPRRQTSAPSAPQTLITSRCCGTCRAAALGNAAELHHR
jgi:hypothetical protein